MGDVFLNRQEQDAIQKLYSTFLSDIKPDRIIPHLFAELALTPFDKQTIDAERTEWGKNDRIYEIILSRASYQNICTMREALIQSRDPKHIHIAGMLPRRRAYAEPQSSIISNNGPSADPFQPPPAYDSLNHPPQAAQQNIQQQDAGAMAYPAAQGDQGQGQRPGGQHGQHSGGQQGQHAGGQQQPRGQQGQYLGGHQGQQFHQQETQPPSLHAPLRPTTSDSYRVARSQNFPQSRPTHFFDRRHQSLEEERPQGGPGPYLSATIGQPVQLDSGHNSFAYPSRQGYGNNPNAAGGHVSMGHHQYHANEGAYGGIRYEPNAPAFGYHGSGFRPNPTRPTREEQDMNQTLNYYVTKEGNRKSGKGLCVIFTNFTEDLCGYKMDRVRIGHFFRESLGYQVLGGENDPNLNSFQNLTREQFMAALENVKAYVNGQFSEIDRLVMFVLSHGDRHGIKTCAQGSGYLEETDISDSPVRITAEQIVEQFTHDKVPKMAGMPKCFFLQHCRGHDTTRAAADPVRGNQPAPRPELEVEPPLKAVGADTAIFYATNPNSQAYVVSETGSWFITETIKQMAQLHNKEHLVDIMTVVNGQLSKRYSRNVAGANGNRSFQMPHIASNLTSKFYLTIPEHL